MVGLKTVKSLQGDQLTVSITFDVTSTFFDFRATPAMRSSNSAKRKTSQSQQKDVNG